MKCAILLSVIVLICVSSCFGVDLTVGTAYNNKLIWQEKAEYMAFPFKKRVKEVFFSNPGQVTIKGIIARDIDHTAGTATITAGGVGATYVNLRLKSERGSGLNYLIEIYG